MHREFSAPIFVKELKLINMERREFMLKTGAVISATTFLSNFGLARSAYYPTNTEQKGVESLRRPNPDEFHQPILKTIALGVNAPSPHNTQSWKFKIVSDTEMLLFIDNNILLPATDPPSRQIHIGAGCFIETAALGANLLGYKADVAYFPEGYKTANDFGVKPVSSIRLSNNEIIKDPLSDFIKTRQTNRRTYKGQVVTEAEFKELLEITGKQHSKTVFINNNFQPYFDIFQKGFEIESRTYSTNEETRNLFRFSEKERAEKRNGISIPQMGYKGLMKNLAENSLDEGNKEKWHSDKSINLSLKNVRNGIESSKGVVIWYTETNDYIDWIKVGRDYVRFSHALTSKNLYAHPYNQAIQEYEEMKLVREQLNELLSIQAPQKIQMIARIGRSSVPYFSYRRNLNDYIVK